jgi:glucosylglycerate synthase
MLSFPGSGKIDPTTMASVPLSDQASASVLQTPPASTLLVSLSPLAPEALSATLANLAIAFPDQPILVATPDPAPPTLPAGPHLYLAPYTPAAPIAGGWVLTAADYLNTFKLIQEHASTACLLLGPQAQSLAPEALHALVDAVQNHHCDLTIPRYTLGPRDGLVNSAILYPATRALFATRSRYPLAIDLAFSPRMAERLAACAQKHTAAGQNAALIWPVAEAATAGFSLNEVPAGTRALPPPDFADLNTLLAQVAGSFFADIDTKAAFWQRARIAYPPKSAPPIRETAPATEADGPPDVQPMLDSFYLAYANLHEIWSLVLPPNSLLGLKKLSLLPPADFRMPDSLWARIVYDFILAYRLRTINRGHLLGALTPLYLAWAASHLLLTSGAAPDSIAPEQHVEALAAAFEAEKPYLVSRWRWPDRFNP